MNTPPRSTGLTVAFALGWIWAVAMGVVSVAALAPALAQGGALGPPLAALLLSLASAVGAQLLRRGRWPHLALGTAAAWIAFLVMVPLKVTALGIALNVAILGIVVTSLRRFR